MKKPPMLQLLEQITTGRSNKQRSLSTMENYEITPRILGLPQISPKSVLSGVASVIHENQYLSLTQKPPHMITFRNDRLKQSLKVRHKGSSEK